MERLIPISALLLLLLARAASAQPALGTGAIDGTVETRIAPPEGFFRVPLAEGSFGAFLRRLPLRPGRPDVRLFDGRLKENQAAHHAVVAMDVGGRDLQQCADAVIRLRSEWLWERGEADGVCFRFTSGDAAAWKRWRAGWRPHVQGSKVRWQRDAKSDGGRDSFRRYLDVVFTYAGSASLEKELVPVPDPGDLRPGDVFIQGGHPGHAVIVLDVAWRGEERRFLLGQSYMPAQELQLLRAPGSPHDPWYVAGAGALQTPEWTFPPGAHRRFSETTCASGEVPTRLRPEGG